MKLNNKGYLLVEIIVASVLAMMIAYFLVDLTVKLKDKNDDLYVDAVLATDRALMTKELMSDINKYKLVTLEKKNDTEVSFVYLINDTLVTKNLTIRNKIFTYGDYSKSFSSDLDVGSIEIVTKPENYENDDIIDSILVLKVPAKTKYSDIDYGINAVIPYSKEEVTVTLPLQLEYSISLSSYQNLSVTITSGNADSYDWIYNSTGNVDETSFPSSNRKNYTGGTITIPTNSAGYYTLCLTVGNSKILKNIYIHNYNSSYSSTSFTINNHNSYINSGITSGNLSITPNTNSLSVQATGISVYSSGSCYEDCIDYHSSNFLCVADTSGVSDKVWDPASSSLFMADLNKLGNGTYNDCSRVSFSSTCVIGNWGYGSWNCTLNNCTPCNWSYTDYRTTIFVEF